MLNWKVYKEERTATIGRKIFRIAPSFRSGWLAVNLPSGGRKEARTLRHAEQIAEMCAMEICLGSPATVLDHLMLRNESASFRYAVWMHRWAEAANIATDYFDDNLAAAVGLIASLYILAAENTELGAIAADALATPAILPILRDAIQDHDRNDLLPAVILAQALAESREPALAS